jgi:molybdopterin-guanine dinucleotide biosynthesis protein A
MKELGNRTDAVVPKHEGKIEPLIAAYDRRCLPVFTRCVNEGVLKMSDALALVRTNFVEVVPGQDGWPADLFRNVNSPADL